MSEWTVLFHRRANRDSRNLAAAQLKDTAEKLIEILRRDPFESPPPFERLTGDLAGFYSRRINRQHRLVYEVDEARHVVRVLRMWTHYE